MFLFALSLDQLIHMERTTESNGVKGEKTSIDVSPSQSIKHNHMDGTEEQPQHGHVDGTEEKPQYGHVDMDVDHHNGQARLRRVH